MKRGEIYRADLDPVIGSEQGGVRPVLIIQNDMGNRHSPTVIVAAITSRMNKPPLPTHVPIMPEESGLKQPSVILLEQVRTLEKRRLMKYLGKVTAPVMAQVDNALGVSLGTRGSRLDG
ncbi:MAG: type II toxin-antitoxin system PemK/MazF family toxin [Clostridia bacterium]|nr:type II toxin-antitoxin system PemK/MazF family toxin [Clostridia bacterium]